MAAADNNANPLSTAGANAGASVFDRIAADAKNQNQNQNQNQLEERALGVARRGAAVP